MCRDRIKKRTSLTRIIIILVFIMFLPALFYSAYQFSTLGEYEDMIKQVYTQQLETILFSVNQYAWDYVGSWTNKIHESLMQKDKKMRSENLSELQETNQTIRQIIFLDTLLNNPLIFPDQSDHSEYDKELAALRGEKNRIQNMLKISRQGYQRIESIFVKDSNTAAEDKMMLFYIQPLENQSDILVVITIRPRVFITEVLAPKLEQIAGVQFSVGIFNIKDQNILFSNETFMIDRASQQKKLWLFPDYYLGIHLAGESIETLAGSRFTNSLILIGLLDVLLIIGGLFLVYNLRKEMQLARLKSDFVSNVSHELRTPLALIRMYAETLEMDRVKSDTKRHEYYRIINYESERLTRLINNILNFSRIESGKKEYKLKPIDLNRIAENVIETYQYQIEKEGFALHREFNPSLPMIVADEEAISESLINLLDNAIKYSPDHKEITVKTDRINNEVFLEVKDTGIGIDIKYQSAVFDKFYRISSALVHDTKGSGMGLALVKHIMHAHRGRIELTSKLKEGSSFKLFFPLKDEDSN